MNKLIRLSPTGIEYGDYAWNFASGCGNNTEGKCKGGGFNCWAYSISQRFEGHYPNGFNPTIHLDALLSPLYLKKPSRILCAFMGDLFWDCPEFDPDRPIIVDGHKPTTLKTVVYHVIRARPQHTFLLLTKQPQNLPAWSPFPDNCWVGVSATGIDMFWKGISYLSGVQATIKYLSLEPLLERIEPFASPESLKHAGINQVIIGAQTGSYRDIVVAATKHAGTMMQYGNKWTLQPPMQYVREIVEACDKAGVKVFLKNNLLELLPVEEPYWLGLTGRRDEYLTARLRQEMPE